MGIDNIQLNCLWDGRERAGGNPDGGVIMMAIKDVFKKAEGILWSSTLKGGMAKTITKLRSRCDGRKRRRREERKSSWGAFVNADVRNFGEEERGLMRCNPLHDRQPTCRKEQERGVSKESQSSKGQAMGEPKGTTTK